jgi:hypothetical protein
MVSVSPPSTISSDARRWMACSRNFAYDHRNAHPHLGVHLVLLLLLLDFRRQQCCLGWSPCVARLCHLCYVDCDLWYCASRYDIHLLTLQLLGAVSPSPFASMFILSFAWNGELRAAAVLTSSVQCTVLGTSAMACYASAVPLFLLLVVASSVRNDPHCMRIESLTIQLPLRLHHAGYPEPAQGHLLSRRDRQLQRPGRTVLRRVRCHLHVTSSRLSD